MNLIELIAKLMLDSKDFDKGVTDAQNKAQNFGNSMSKVGGTLQKTGAIATAAITAPLVAMAVGMFNSASDLNETTSKIGIVFDSSAERVKAFGDTAAKSMGMSKNAALSAAGTYGALFDSMEIGPEKSADMSMSLVKLAGDLASFNNMDPAEVLDKLRAGLVGESEPLRALGIQINDAAIKEKALEMGLYSGTGALDDAAKAQAVYALMFEKTTSAQGDFERTSEGAANQQRIMTALFQDASANLGTQLLPIGLKIITFLSNLIDKFSNMSPAGQKVILIIGGILAAIGPLLTIIGTVMTVVGGLTTFLAGPTAVAIGAAISAILPVVAIIAAVIAVIGLLYAAWKNNWFGIRDITAAAGNQIAAAFNSVRNAIMGVWDWIQKMAGALTNIKLPDWMTPGSPTPWELGLRGVSSAMGELSARSMPGLSATLNSNLGPGANSPGAGLQTSNSKSISIQINNPIGETSEKSMNKNMQQLAYLGEV